MNNLLQRTLTGAVFVVVILFFCWYNGYAFTGLFLLVSVLGLREFYGLMERTGHQVNKWAGLCCGFLVFLLNASVLLWQLSFPVLFLQLPVILFLFIAELFRKKKQPFVNILLTAGGIVYIALGFSCFTATGFTGKEYQYEFPVGFLVLLWANDTGAYLSGRVLGRHKMFERISPKKTWEGFTGGALFSMAVSAWISAYFTLLSTWEWIGMSVLIVLFGTLGDLIESLLKRSTGVKDSGQLLPGHGGVLDRFDSLILAAPFVYAYLLWIS